MSLVPNELLLYQLSLVDIHRCSRVAFTLVENYFTCVTSGIRTYVCTHIRVHASALYYYIYIYKQTDCPPIVSNSLSCEDAKAIVLYFVRIIKIKVAALGYLEISNK